MNVRTAYDRRESLSHIDLIRLLAALQNELAFYIHTSRNYPQDRMEKYGKTFISILENKIEEVKRLLDEKA